MLTKIGGDYLAKITQQGYKFHYSNQSKKLPVEQEWSLERVAAYMCIIEACRILSQRYEQAKTYCSKLGMTMYELENLDAETRKDLNTLTTKFLSEVLETAQDDPAFLAKPLSAVLDGFEEKVSEMIKDAELPIEAFGSVIEPEPLLTRPTEDEYEERLSAESIKESKKRRRLLKQIADGVVGKHVKIEYGNYENDALVTKQTDKYLYLTVYDDSKCVLREDMRVPIYSNRYISEFR